MSETEKLDEKNLDPQIVFTTKIDLYEYIKLKIKNIFFALSSVEILNLLEYEIKNSVKYGDSFRYEDSGNTITYRGKLIGCDDLFEEYSKYLIQRITKEDKVLYWKDGANGITIKLVDIDTRFGYTETVFNSDKDNTSVENCLVWLFKNLKSGKVNGNM